MATPLISCLNLSKSFGSKELFSSLSFTIYEESKIGLVGTNGAGKTTLLKILAGKEHQDTGEVVLRKGLTMAYVPQHPQSSDKTVWEEIHSASSINHTRLDKDPVTWSSIVLSRFGFSDTDINPLTSRKISELSGGWQKRVDIAKAYAICPDLFLFDEPTNHLDMESIEWLEQFIKKELNQYLIVSHDRAFLDAVSASVIEINPKFFNGHLEVEGTYTQYVTRRQEYIEAMLKRSQGLASKVRTESDWLARGPKARTTKAEARVRSALSNIDQLRDLESRLTVNKLSLKFQERECETRKLITLKNVSYQHNENSQAILKGLDFVISPKMRLGIVGPNGCGKTTLLKLIAQEHTPTQGTIKYAPGVQIVYFDQTRKKIPETWTLGHALGRGREFVEFAGHQVHIRGWAKKFLFDPDRLTLPISQLSGGEKARLHIAHLITEPADVLILDEPTNDLDIDTLEVLEECLTEFEGAVLLVCHDRMFLKNVTTELLALGLENEKNCFYPDIEQWQRAVSRSKKPNPEQKPALTQATITTPTKKTNKLSYKEEKERETLPFEIEQQEREIDMIQKEMEEMLTLKPNENVSHLYTRLHEKETLLSSLWKRWEELEEKKQSL